MNILAKKNSVMKQPDQTLSVDEARKVVVESISPVGTEDVAVEDSHERVLASDVVAREDIPSFDNASMDGFAVRSADVAGAAEGHSVELKLSSEVAAGEEAKVDVGAGGAVRVMTGAPIPQGADAVIEQELATVRNGSVMLSAAAQAGRNIRPKGEDVRAGEVVLRRGTFLKAVHAGVLASLGCSRVRVHKKPRVAVLTTGNELLEVNEPLAPGKIRNSNAYSLAGLIEETGCHPANVGRARDEEKELRQKIQDGLGYDALITSGGVSVGKYDLVLKVLEDVGVQRRFWKVNIKPGGPMAFGVYPKSECPIPVFCLPGNPVSTVVTFIEFVRPGLQRLMGMESPQQPIRLTAELEHDIRKSDSKRHFSRGVLRNERGKLFVRTTGSQSSGVLTSLVSANCLIIVPEDKKEIRAGEKVQVELL